MQGAAIELKKESGPLMLPRSKAPGRQRDLPKQWFLDAKKRKPEISGAVVESSDEGQDASEGNSDDDDDDGDDDDDYDDNDDDDVHAEANPEVDPEATVKESLAEYTTFFEQGGIRDRSWMFT